MSKMKKAEIVASSFMKQLPCGCPLTTVMDHKRDGTGYGTYNYLLCLSSAGTVLWYHYW